tara:strand:- start:155 stop:787 length:633 start_codon:yes stop_codon:yes gene_type:complete
MVSFIELIKNKNIAFVGPSSSLLGKNLGKLIDSYDIVIKLNNFHKLSSEDYGNKVDILFYNFYKSTPDNSIKEHNTKFIMASHSFDNHRDNLYHFKQSQIQNCEIHHELFLHNSIDEYFVNLLKSKPWKTSGFNVMCLLLNNLNNIHSLTLFGIDFNYYSYNKNYRDIGVVGHDMKHERELFKKMYFKFKDSNKIHINDKGFLEYINDHS